MTTLSSAALRNTLRKTRQQLTQQQQDLHAHQACQILFHSGYLNAPLRLGIFLSQDGELGTQETIQALRKQSHIELFLPVLETLPDWHMGFAPFPEGCTLQNNRFNIPEPDVPHTQHRSGAEMDLVLMPLVGFDPHGHRMGMGGGYYDRTFAFKLHHPDRRPFLVGWAHSCQQVESLPHEPWDVPLDAIITEQTLTEFHPRPKTIKGR
jgi:5-formyltetrahydrofolate cyclo-ligase